MAMLDQLPQILVSGLTTGAVYALLALGYNLVHNAVGVVNFAQGDFTALGGFLMYSLLESAGLPVPLAFLGAFAGAALVGALMERLCLAPARSRRVMTLIFITMAASILLRGGMKEIWGKQALPLPPLSPDKPIRLFGAVFTPQNLWVAGAAAVALGLTALFFKRTLTGKAMRAMAADRGAAMLMGVDAARLTTISFALAGALGALAGVLITPITALSYDVGLMLGLKGFAAAVLGGYGSFAGAVVGGVVLGLSESAAAGWLSSAYKDVVAFAILLLVLFLGGRGILSPRKGRG